MAGQDLDQPNGFEVHVPEALYQTCILHGLILCVWGQWAWGQDAESLPHPCAALPAMQQQQQKMTQGLIAAISMLPELDMQAVDRTTGQAAAHDKLMHSWC